jgi:ABC-2 type transport system permease protein
MIRFIKTAIITSLKLITNSKLEFWINIFLALIKQALFLLTWYFFFNESKYVGSWQYKDLLLMYGVISFGVGFIEMFFYGAKELPQIIEQGNLDFFLLQPKSLLLNVAMSRGRISSLGDILVSLYCFLLSGYMFTKPLLILLTLPFTILFIFSMHLYISSISLYLKNCNSLIRELHSNSLLVATQPTSSYYGFFRIFTLTILPVMYLSFFPIEFIKKIDIYSGVIASLGTIVFFLLARFFFYNGIKKYQLYSN